MFTHATGGSCCTLYLNAMHLTMFINWHNYSHWSNSVMTFLYFFEIETQDKFKFNLVFKQLFDIQEWHTYWHVYQTYFLLSVLPIYNVLLTSVNQALDRNTVSIVRVLQTLSGKYFQVVSVFAWTILFVNQNWHVK
jgi:hypothetical protein